MSLDTGTLYILVRTDLEDFYTAGKIAAQVAHAANVFQNDVIGLKTGDAEMDAHLDLAADWFKQASGFGRTIVLNGGTVSEMVAVTEQAIEDGFPSSPIIDPTFPRDDGTAEPMMTCTYIFTGCREEFPVRALEGLDLL